MKTLLYFLLICSLFNNAFGQVNFGSSGWDYSIGIHGMSGGTPTCGVPLHAGSGSSFWTLPTFVKDPLNWAGSTSTTKPLPMGYPVSYIGSVANNLVTYSTSPAPMTIYIRQTITLPNPVTSYSSFSLTLKIDDGAIVYLNGTEVARNNLPSTTITPQTPSSTAVTTIVPQTFTIPGGSFPIYSIANPEKITIAVELHQGGPNACTSTSSDAFFDMEFLGTLGAVTPMITRGPYLQLAADNSTDLITTSRPSEFTKQFRWKTNTPVKGAVKYWVDIASPTFMYANESILGTDHLINIGSLIDSKKYRYEIGYIDPISTLFTSLSSDPDYFFLSGPQYIDKFYKKTKIWVTGDIGFNMAGYGSDSFAPSVGLPTDPGPPTYKTVQSNVISGFNSWASNPSNLSTPLDLWLLLGDNAYLNGTDNDYDNYFFTALKNTKMMKQATIIPSPGNHDYYESRLSNGIGGGTPTIPIPTRGPYVSDPGSIIDRLSRNYAYFDIFKSPQKGQAGGLPSNSTNYYSFNSNFIHFISLDTYGADNVSGSRRSLWEDGSPQMTWLENDLAQNDIAISNDEILWTVVIMHHPPYTKGSYDSDLIHNGGTVGFNDGIMNAIANKVVRKLEAHKVDLVLTGHSHSYERSKLLKGLFQTTEPSVATNTSGVTISNATFMPHASFSAASNNVVSSSGKWDGSPNSCPYETTSTKLGGANGIVYAVVGSGSTISNSPKLLTGHNALPHFNYNKGGSMFLEIDFTKLVAKWIDETGAVGDQFTIMKNVTQQPEAVEEISATSYSSTNSLSYQKLFNPTLYWSPAVPILTPPASVPGSTSTLHSSGFYYEVINPQIGPYYKFTEASGCLSQNIRFHITPDCWPNTGTLTSPSTLTINNYIDSPVTELIRSNGIIDAYNSISPTSTVIYQSVRSVILSYIPPIIPLTPSPYKFQAGIPTPLSLTHHPYFLAERIATCP
jgi:Calcineurin-like phosphoesterase